MKTNKSLPLTHRSRHVVLLFVCASFFLGSTCLSQTTLFGDTAVEAQRDTNSLGTAEAFQTSATTSGSLAAIRLYVDNSSTATKIAIGLYGDSSDHPGTLLSQGIITTIAAGAWNSITVPGVSVTSGTKYWIAVLGTGNGTIFFRDRNRGPCHSETSASKTLTSLPATWTTGGAYSDCPLSAYGTGSASSTPILTLNPTLLSFTAVQGGANPAAANVSISNTGSGTLSFTITSDSRWLTASPTSGSAPQTLQVSADISGLAANTYTGHLTVTANGAQGSPATVTVTLAVSSPPPPQPELSVSPLTVSFTATQGGANPNPATVNVTNAGSGTLSFTASSDAAWLAVSPVSGSAPAPLQLTPTMGALVPGTYTGHVTITSTGSLGSPVTVTATLTINAPAPPSSASAIGDWLMIDHDSSRGGFAPDESAISTSTAANLKLRWSLNVDGQVSAQPLYAGSITVGSTVHDLLIVATSGNSIYALDANSGDVLWKRNLGAQSASCVLPGGFGVFGPAVVDRTALRLYAIADDGTFRSLSLIDGTDTAPALSLVANPGTNKVWGGLNRLGNNIYFATGSNGCDTAPWRGTIYAVDVSGATPVLANSFVVVPSIPAPDGGGGVWSYGGVSIDSATGNVFATTGSDSNEGYTLYANRMIVLDSNLNLLGSFGPSEPSSFPCLSAPCDLDFASTPILFQPNGCSLLTAAGNKNGNLYLMKVSDLIVSGSPLETLTLTTANDSLGNGGVGGVPAFWPQGNMLFVADRGGVTGIAGGIVGLNVTNACTVDVGWSVSLGGPNQPNSTPTVANGVVFVGTGVDGTVHAFNAASGNELWSSGGQNGVSTYGAPMVARGKLYFGSWNGYSASSGGSVYSFAPDPFPGPVLAGDQTVESQIDFNPSGLAEAFQVTPATSGTVGALRIYVDPSSSATKLFGGLYADAGGHPGALLTQASINRVTPGSWITITVPTVEINAGTSYWIAILGTNSGTFKFHDGSLGTCSAENSAQNDLTQLPANWSSGAASTSCPLSAFVVGITPSQPSLSVIPATLPLSAPQGQSAVGTINISNSGGGTLTYSASSDSSWLSVSPTSGTAPEALQVAANSSGLAQGAFTGHLTVTAAGAQGSPVTVTVNFLVQPPPPPNPVLTVSPTTLSFSGTQGGTNPSPLTTSITNTGSGSLSFTAASDASWLTAIPTSGMAPQTLQVGVSLAGLAANTYTGHTTITGSAGVANSPATVTVTLIVAPVPPSSQVLFGDTATESQIDTNANGIAEAFQTTAVANGTLGTMSVYLDPSSTASTFVVGLYSDSNGNPGTLLSQGSTNSPKAGTFNIIAMPAANVVKDTTYWIAILSTGTGTIRFRDRNRGPCLSRTSAQSSLTSLPTLWSSGSLYTDCPVSAFGKTP